MKVRVETSYTIHVSTDIVLPDGKTWDDVKDYDVKWGHLLLTFEDDSKFETDLGDASMDTVDWKYPSDTLIHIVDETNDTETECVVEVRSD